MKELKNQFDLHVYRKASIKCPDAYCLKGTLDTLAEGI